MEWLTSLVLAGKAQKLSGTGYPNRYIAAARDVFPALGLTCPFVMEPWTESLHLPGDRHAAIQVNLPRIATCSPEKQLTIDTWDRS